MLLQNAEKHMSDPAFQKSALNTINEAVGRMQHLIGKFSAGRDQLPPASKPVDLNNVIQDLAAQAGLDAHQRITFRFVPGKKIPPALGNPIQIRRTLENLMVNAVEAMPEQGSLEISTGLHDGLAEPWVWVRVRDTGCGMTREFISTRLFKPFESTKKRGLGIGMYQVRQMVEADGGRIQLESTPGEGTTFEVYWRAQLKPESSSP
jgi:signal transduction histidine kinase